MSVTAVIQKTLSPEFTLDVAFTASPGVTILFGASGSGKTTVLRCLAGLTRPDAGTITVGEATFFDSAAGIDVPVRHRGVGYVFQQLALFPHLTIAENIAYGLFRRTAADAHERVQSIAESFRISGILSRTPARVSGGERQRAALARALVTSPSLLLLDEPLSALDHANQSRIMDDLRRWNETHRIPMIYVTHNHREVYALGEHVIVLDGGRVIAKGSPHDVLDHPPHGVLASLAGFENVLDATVVERHERAGTMRCRLCGLTTELEVPLGEAAAGHGVRIAIRAGDILLANEPPRGVSARNVLRGTLAELTRQGPTMVAAVDAGARFVVHLTPGGVDALGLERGAPVWLIVKTYSCRTAPWHS